MDKQIKDFILQVRANERIATFDEATTKQAIILKLLSELGWNIFNTDEVKPEYSVANKRVDYSLRLNNANKVFLEVKKINSDIENHQKQLLDYSFQEGVKLAVLTNGISWWFYLPLNEGNWEQRKFFAIDIGQQNPEDTAKRFIDFLSRNSVNEGTAVKKAEHLLISRVKESEIQRNLPKAWHKILSGPDELLIELLNETLEKICGHKAESEQIAIFIKNLSSFEKGTEKHQIETAIKQIDMCSRNRVKKSPFPPDGTICRFSYKGDQYEGVIKDRRLFVGNTGAFTSFSAASVEISKTSRNGWRDWEIKLPGTSEWLLSDTWRKRQA